MKWGTAEDSGQTTKKLNSLATSLFGNDFYNNVIVAASLNFIRGGLFKWRI